MDKTTKTEKMNVENKEIDKNAGSVNFGFENELVKKSSDIEMTYKHSFENGNTRNVYIDSPAISQTSRRASDVSLYSNDEKEKGKQIEDSQWHAKLSIRRKDKTKDNDDHPIDANFTVKEKRPIQFRYETCIWLIFVITTILCIVDRFVMKGDAVLHRGGKKVSKLWGDNFGETLTNVIWGLTARLIITSQNMMFYTGLWCIPNILVEYCPKFIVIEGIRDIHIKMHRLVGIYLIAIPSLAHVLVIFLPPLIDKTELTYHPPSEFNYSSQWGNLNWTKFYDPAAVQNWTFNDEHGVHLTSDEIYRFVLMIVIFCVLFPLSRSKLLNDRSYSFAMIIHSFSGVWYAIDNIRKITHGLAHVFNLPMLVIWCIDRLLSIALYRKNNATIVSSNIIGNNEYLEVRVKFDKKSTHNGGVGDIYYLLQNRGLRNFLSWERAHPFTSFSNHDSNDNSWDIGFLITIMNDDAQWWPAWTRRLIYQSPLQDEIRLKTWGPYRSSVWQLYNSIMNVKKQKPYTLFASGSGLGYLLDVLGVLAYRKDDQTKSKPIVEIHYTVRSKMVKSVFSPEAEKMLQIIKDRSTANIKFLWYETKTEKSQLADHTSEDVEIKKVSGRIDFEKIVSNVNRDSTVYFVGRPSIADYIHTLCTKYNVPMIKDFMNSQRGHSDKTLFLKYFKYSVYSISLIVAFSVIIGIYIKV